MGQHTDEFAELLGDINDRRAAFKQAAEAQITSDQAIVEANAEKIAVQGQVLEDFKAFANHIVKTYLSNETVSFDDLDEEFKGVCREWLLAHGYTNDVVEHYVEYFHALINAWYREEDMTPIHERYLPKSAIDIEGLKAEQDALERQFEEFLCCISPGDIERARAIHAKVVEATEPYMPAKG